MVKPIKCPGCKKSFQPGRSYTQHTNACRRFDRAEEKIQREHKIASAKKAADKKIEKERRLHKAAQDAAAPMEEVEDLQSEPEDVQMHHNPPEPLKSPSPPARVSGRPARIIRKPPRYRDELPPNPPVVVRQAADDTLDEPQQATEPAGAADLYRTDPNNFGVYREYAHGVPTITPDEYFTLSSVCDSATLARDPAEGDTKSSWWSSFGSSGKTVALAEGEQPPGNEYFAPFLNPSIFLLMSWFYNGSTIKSFADIDKLVHGVIRHPHFQASDFESTFLTAREAKRMDKSGDAESSSSKDSFDEKLPFSPNDGWIQGSVSIAVPCEGFKFKSEADAPRFVVENVWYRRPLEVLKMAFAEPAALKFTTTPYKEFWKPSADEPDERIHSESYAGDLFNAEYERLMSEPRHGPNKHLEAFVAAIGLYSDSTHVATFGNASLWPFFMYVLNQSKYIRAQPGEFAAHHIAYIPKLGDGIQDWYQETFGIPATSEVLAHLRRELMQAIWDLLLDGDMMRAYREGEPVQLYDDVLRAMYPRFVFYSMDYPEKMLVACLKHLGKCLCPRCLSTMDKVPQVGSKTDRRTRVKLERKDTESRQYDIEQARKLMFEQGKGIEGRGVKSILNPSSAFPTRNTFSKHLFKHGFDFYQLFVVDFMHEVEIGVWKSLFTHLMRILYAFGHDTIQTLNSRYQQISSFGRSTIRKFTKNASDMKKMAARDYEDLLQCVIPVFEDLLPKKHNRIIQNLLFEMATWHALAKLRLHTETTIDELDNSCTRLCDLLRKFKKEVCSEYVTRDLPAETAARGRRQAAKAKKAVASGRPERPLPVQKSGIRDFNLQTYKLHSLPAYAKSIRNHGTTDNTSSQLGESEHKRSKRFYPIIRKGDHVRGIAKHVYRERTLFRTQRIMKRNQQSQNPVKSTGVQPSTAEDEEVLEPTPPENHHQISKDVRHKVDVQRLLSDNKNDSALVNFLPRLKDHLLARLTKADDLDQTYTPKERSQILLLNDRIYQHKVLRVNYTTYDMRRSQDSLNPRNRADIMVLSHEDDADNAHPYWYARIVGIYHVMVIQKTTSLHWSQPQKMEFLFVRWFGLDREKPAGWKARKLYQLGFLDGTDPAAFGFIDPLDVIRAIHLIPRFSLGRTDVYLKPSIARSSSENDEDWMRYYVNMFVDRDMVMRFRGGGVGHASTRAATDIFKNDRDKMDTKSRAARHAPASSSEGSSSESEGKENGGSEEEHVSEKARSESDGYTELDDSDAEGWESASGDEATNSDEEEVPEQSDEEEDDGGIIEELDALGFAEY